jgi:hypothetical protein
MEGRTGLMPFKLSVDDIEIFKFQGGKFEPVSNSRTQKCISAHKYITDLFIALLQWFSIKS